MKKFVYLLTFLFCFKQGFSQEKETLLFVGTYTNGKPDKGIYLYNFDVKTGKLTLKSTGENLINPSFLTISPNGKYLYACTDTKLPVHGTVSAFEIDSLKEKINFINKQTSNGENPVYVSVHKNNRLVVTGNYSEGNVTVFTTENDGKLKPYVQSIQFFGSSINPERQEKPHIHSTIFSPQNDFLYLPDLGTDKIRAFKFDENSTNPLIDLESYTVQTKAGSGPRHIAFHPNQKYAYCIEEMGGTVSAYDYQNGKLTLFQQILSNQTKTEIYSSADIHVSPDGKFLYASNRVENTISIFTINKKGKLKLKGFEPTQGDTPRNFNIDPTGNFLLVANQNGNNVVVFRRDIKTGSLKKVGNDIKIPNPSCLQFKQYYISSRK